MTRPWWRSPRPFPGRAFALSTAPQAWRLLPLLLCAPRGISACPSSSPPWKRAPIPPPLPPEGQQLNWLLFLSRVARPAASASRYNEPTGSLTNRNGKSHHHRTPGDHWGPLTNARGPAVAPGRGWCLLALASRLISSRRVVQSGGCSPLVTGSEGSDRQPPGQGGQISQYLLISCSNPPVCSESF